MGLRFSHGTPCRVASQSFAGEDWGAVVVTKWFSVVPEQAESPVTEWPGLLRCLNPREHVIVSERLLGPRGNGVAPCVSPGSSTALVVPGVRRASAPPSARLSESVGTLSDIDCHERKPSAQVITEYDRTRKTMAADLDKHVTETESRGVFRDRSATGSGEPTTGHSRRIFRELSANSFPAGISSGLATDLRVLPTRLREWDLSACTGNLY